jgi:hypothetical protein
MRFCRIVECELTKNRVRHAGATLRISCYLKEELSTSYVAISVTTAVITIYSNRERDNVIQFRRSNKSGKSTKKSAGKIDVFPERDGSGMVLLTGMCLFKS